MKETNETSVSIKKDTRCELKLLYIRENLAYDSVIKKLISFYERKRG